MFLMNSISRGLHLRIFGQYLPTVGADVMSRRMDAGDEHLPNDVLRE